MVQSSLEKRLLLFIIVFSFEKLAMILVASWMPKLNCACVAASKIYLLHNILSKWLYCLTEASAQIVVKGIYWLDRLSYTKSFAGVYDFFFWWCWPAGFKS
ncbi:hypothetical protein FRX31_003318 [Thalictrum thalictroides]|uniref:Uncharacterized protein n=1 Tax=Thalictrum thalictroides TaxID=46969 RepID=A0A7J6XBC1_THATH|nr:hypothetical protein FRX31_003318 [Thalictrum thalictroides]